MADARRSLPRFNHVAMSVPADLLDEGNRAEILGFYGDVFGWGEAPGMTLDRERMVLMAHRLDQFVFIIADDEPMRAPRLDHWGQAVSSRGELDDIYARAAAYRDKDDRVDLIDVNVDEYPGVKIHSFYVRFLLPMMTETQYFEWDEGLLDNS